jgi:hypothetical protein
MTANREALEEMLAVELLLVPLLSFDPVERGIVVMRDHVFPCFGNNRRVGAMM